MGWSESWEGAQRMTRAIDKHPVWTAPEIRDRMDTLMKPAPSPTLDSF